MQDIEKVGKQWDVIKNAPSGEYIDHIVRRYSKKRPEEMTMSELFFAVYTALVNEGMNEETARLWANFVVSLVKGKEVDSTYILCSSP